MKKISVEVKGEKKTFLMSGAITIDTDFKNKSYYVSNGHKFSECKVIEEGLKIPFKDSYLDVCIEMKGKRFFTQKRYLTEEVQTETMELMVPDLAGVQKQYPYWCLLEDTRCHKTDDICAGLGCNDCIFCSENIKYLS